MTLYGALIGCGYVSRNHLRAWQQVAGAEIVAVCDLDGVKARDRALEFGVPAFYADYRQMLAEHRLHFVDIATRPHSHLELTRAAAEHGLHVLCQKPMAETMAEAEQMTSVCQRAGVILMINENFRHQAWFRKINALLAAGDLGTPHFARFETRWRSTLPQPEFEGQGFFREMPHLIVFELGVHFLDTARFLFGEAQAISAYLRRVSPHIAGEDLALVVAQFDRVTCLLDTNWCSLGLPGPPGITPALVTIEGSAGTVRLQTDGTLTLQTEQSQAAWQFPDNTITQSYVAAQQHFVECLLANRQPDTSGVDTLQTLALVFAAYQSAAQGRVIWLSSPGN